MLISWPASRTRGSWAQTLKMPGSYLRCLPSGYWHISIPLPNLRRPQPHTDPDLCKKIHYKDSNQPANQGFQVEGGGFVQDYPTFFRQRYSDSGVEL